MAIPIPPELEQRVIELARAKGRDPNDLLAELVAGQLDRLDAMSPEERQAFFERARR